MFEKPRNTRLADDFSGFADLAALRADIAKGVSDIKEGRVSALNVASIKAAGRAIKSASFNAV